MSSAVNPPRDDRGTGTNPSGGTGGYRPAPATPAPGSTDNRELVRQQRDRFGGMKFGACFFGWLAATGTAVILTGLLAAASVGIGVNTGLTPQQAGANAPAIGLTAAIVLLVVVLVAYLAGGYVAGRMARFNGVKQGVGVWLWAIIVAIVLGVLGFIAGDQFNVLSRLSGLPSLPVSGQSATVGAVISIVAVAVVALVGAILGGLAGMRYHRRIDHATFDDEV
ncbi:hypothetical protein [Microlunatus flavus]|uniref:Uncharacterized protein n=1 Tax=Microlunatus flavus TaxID=1036181 RepID=A0A1H9A487_9ACTN|nr:hypothetical protein [Microlunatus flavus]SEP71546.1 hypothetical protein SAMN05421756_101471 [Microlunatus flavus]